MDGYLMVSSNSVARLALLPVDSLFGPTMQAAFLLVETDAPMASADIVGLAADRPLSLTTDPIDL